jgi:uncharacterized Zn finger protein
MIAECDSCGEVTTVRIVATDNVSVDVWACVRCEEPPD